MSEKSFNHVINLEIDEMVGLMREVSREPDRLPGNIEMLTYKARYISEISQMRGMKVAQRIHQNEK